MRRTIAPIRRSDIGWFVGAYAALVGLFYLVGRAILASDGIVRADTDAAQWFADRRTRRLNHLTLIGSSLSETVIRILVTIVLSLVMFAVWRRFREPMVIILPLILEAMVFITVTYLVGRPRPAVPRLEGSPVDSSFPSGHAAAAFVYNALLIVVFWHTRKWWIRILAGVVTMGVALAVGISRAYRGMHHISDVLAGFLLGAMSIAVCWWLVERVLRRNVAPDDGGAPAIDDGETPGAAPQLDLVHRG